MQQLQCLICKQYKNDVQNYRDDINIEPKLIAAHEVIRAINFNDPLHVCRQCVNQVQNVRPVRIPDSQAERSPDTTVEEVMTQSQPSKNESSESIGQRVAAFDMPTTKEQIKGLFPNNQVKRFKLEKLLKEPMPSTVRKRKYEEISKSNDGEGMTESQQASIVQGLIQEELRQRFNRSTGAGDRRRNGSNSSLSSLGSFSESLGRVASNVTVPPREAASQVVPTPVINNVARRRPITDSLSSSDSSIAAQTTRQPERPPTPDFEPLPPPPAPPSRPQRRLSTRSSTSSSSDQTVPRPRPRKRKTNEGTAHTNMGAPSRPHIPHTGATGNAVRSSKEIHGA